jgi:tetratricopeptide (TPR) repeat protein
VRILFLILFILNLLNINGQNFDSLKIAALDLLSDTDRVNLFYKEGFANRSIDPQYSYDCAKKAEVYAQKVGLPFYTAKANNLLGILFYRKGDLNTALSYHKIALNLRTLINDKKGIALSQTNLGNIYSELTLYKLAEDAYLKALAINNDLNLSEQIDNCLLNLGVLSADLKMINVAENYFNRAITNAKKRNDYGMEAACLNNLAVINTIKQDFDAAIANSYNSIKAKELMDNEMEMADSYLNIAVAYIKKKEAPEAFKHLKIADSIILKFNYLAAKIQSLKAYSEYYELEKNYEASLLSLKQFTTLKDSLTKASKEIGFENTFIETKISEQMIAETEKNKLPFVFFVILIIMILGLTAFIFKFKR